MLSFDDTRIAFRSKTNKDLQLRVWAFKLVRRPFLVRLLSLLTLFALKLRLPIGPIIRSTVFQIFCGGEDIREAKEKVAYLREQKVKSIITHSAEAKENDRDFERCMNQTLKTIEAVKNDPEVPFSVFKPTSLIRFDLLKKLHAGEALSAKEEKEWAKAKERFFRICEAASNSGQRLNVDAEETWIQKPVDDLVHDAMARFNGEKAIIYNTIQFYRKDRLAFLKESHKKAVEGGYILGVKIVRGAYLEKERERAKKYQYPSPIHDTKAETDADFDQAIAFILDHLESIRMLMGTHNQESTLLLTRLIKEKGIAKDDQRIFTAQLMGMSDSITFNMAEDGYNAIKYVPYGHVRDVIPYLIRRAEENSSIQGQMGRELQLLQLELERRKKEAA